MNYELEVGKDQPVVFNSLNGGRPPLVSGGGTSTLLSALSSLTFAPFNKGYESVAFTLEVWFRPKTNTGELIVMGHTDEGVIWTGSKFILRVKLADGTTLEDSYTPADIKAFHVVMIYTVGSLNLYIDGTMVVSLGMPSVQFSSVGNGISLNRGTGTALYDSAALYYGALSDTDIKRHYSWGNDIPDAKSIAMLRAGMTWSLTYNDVNVYESIVFDTVNPDALMWRQSVPISAMLGNTTAGVHVTYVGSGVTLSYSLDGQTWTVSPNKTTILEDATVTDAMLLVKMDFADDNAWVDSLRLDFLNNRTMVPISGPRPVVFKSTAMDQVASNQLDYQENWGAVIRNGYVEIQPDPSTTPQNVATIEMWAKIDGTTGFFIGNTGSSYAQLAGTTLTTTGMTAYRNGVAHTNPIAAGEWAHWVFVLTTANNSKIRLGNNLSGDAPLNLTVGHVAVYSTSMTAAEVLSLYNRNIGAPALRVNDTSGITTTEDVPAVQIYAESWSYISGGR